MRSRNELKNDEFYVGEWDKKRVIFQKQLNKKEPAINSVNKFIYAEEVCNGSNITFRLATQEEKAWLNACIKEDKYISYEEFLKIYKPNVQTNEEYLLEEAKIKYPIGTKFHSIFPNKNSIFTITDDNFTFHNNNSMITVSTDLGNGTIVKNGCSIYAKGEWAEIIKLPEKQTEFKKGDYIVLVTSLFTLYDFSLNFCYKQKKNNTYLLSELDNKGSYVNGYSSCRHDNTGEITWRYATPEEIVEYDRIGKPYDVTTSVSKENDIPEYYEFIGENGSNFTKGKIYKIRNLNNLENEANFIDDKGDKNRFSGVNYKHFKPSTLEAYTKQEWKDLNKQYPLITEDSYNTKIEVGDEVEVIRPCRSSINKIGFKGYVTEIKQDAYLKGFGRCVGYRINGWYEHFSGIKLIKKHSNTTIKEQVDISSPQVTSEITVPRVLKKTEKVNFDFQNCEVKNINVPILLKQNKKIKQIKIEKFELFI